MDAILHVLRRSWDTVALTIVLAVWLAASVPLSRTAAWIPRIVLMITLALVIVQLVREARAAAAIVSAKSSRGRPMAASDADSEEAAANLAEETLAPTRATSPFFAVMWVGAWVLGVLVLGAVTGSALCTFAYLRRHARASSLSSAIFALALGACLQLAFSSVLHVELFHGWLWSMRQ